MLGYTYHYRYFLLKKARNLLVMYKCDNYNYYKLLSVIH